MIDREDSNSLQKGPRQYTDKLKIKPLGYVGRFVYGYNGREDSKHIDQFVRARFWQIFGVLLIFMLHM